MAQSLSKRIIERCNILGFTQAHIASTQDLSQNIQTWLSEYIQYGYHGTMTWMAETFERRAHPHNMWPDAKSAIVLGLNYGPDSDPLATLNQTDKATISVYARHRDYHTIIKGRLKELASLVAKELKAEVKVFVDTAPLMEKPLAALAGLGWQGKHTNLVSREFGSWLFIGTILTNIELQPTKSENDHCGSCTACLDICPTNAFPAPYKLDARRCISYLTIEHKGPVDKDLRALMGNHIYGCDDCLAVCPWNKFASSASEIKLQAREDLKTPKLAELAVLNEDSFRRKFSGSPIKRIGWARFTRNILYAIGNSGLKSLRPSAENYANHPDPVIRDAAIWALTRLS